MTEDDMLDIPPFLRLSIPENLERWKQARKNWRPGARAPGEPKRKVYYDRKGRQLPLSTDEATLAIVRQIEAAEIAREKTASAEEKELKKIEQNAKAQVKAAAKVTKRALKAH